MSARKRLTPTEQYIAYLIGGGIALAMIALLLMGLGTIENNDITISMLLVGLALVVLGIGAWLILVRPWEKFDDLKTPYYTGREEPAKAAVEEPVKVAPEEPAEVAPEVPAKAAIEEPAEVAPEEPAKPDDLTLIEGIGPKTAAALTEAGITTFAQVAAMTPAELVEKARAHGARVGKADTWPEQAKQAASAALTALQDFQGRIKSGVAHDKLTEIEGIGPKSQEALYQAGIRTYQDVAKATPDTLRAGLETAGLKLIDPGSWPEQARLIVSGDLTALKELQDRLRGGR